MSLNSCRASVSGIETTSKPLARNSSSIGATLSTFTPRRSSPSPGTYLVAYFEPSGYQFSSSLCPDMASLRSTYFPPPLREKSPDLTTFRPQYLLIESRRPFEVSHPYPHVVEEHNGNVRSAG